MITDSNTHPWDLSIENLREIILSFDEDHPQKQDFLEQLNRSVAQLTLQPIAPSEQTTYLVWFVILVFETIFVLSLSSSYDIVNQFIDTFVDEMIIVHQTLQIPEPTSESYPDIDLCSISFPFEISPLTRIFSLDGYEFDSWKKFFEYTKTQESKMKSMNIPTNDLLSSA